jgi:adenylate kinase
MSGRRKTILISGVPGVGKTTVSRLLAERMGCQLVNISEMAEREGLTEGSDPLRGTSVVDLDRIRGRLAEIVEASEGATIVEGHFAYDVVSPGEVSHAFVLRRAPWRLREELEARGYSKEKVRENVEAEMVDICLVEAQGALGPERVCEIDTTDRPPDEVVDEIASIIHGSTPCRRRRVDWLGQDETKRMLEGRDVRRG